MKHWAQATGFSLLAAAILPYAYAQYRYRSHNWVPLEVLAKLEPNSQTVSTKFVTDLDGFYKVSLAFAPVDVEAEECLVGDPLFKSSCNSGANGLDLGWSVLGEQAGREVVVADYQLYRPAEFEGAGSVETVLGGFDAHKGGVYQIAIRVRYIAPELQSASPKMRVEAANFYWEKWVIYAQMSFLFAAVLAPIGIVVLGWGYFADRTKTRTPMSPPKRKFRKATADPSAARQDDSV
jgi:hypothetical protein